MIPTLLSSIRRTTVLAAAFAALLTFGSPRSANADDYPPGIYVNGVYFGGGAGSYSGSFSNDIPFSVFVSGGTATLSGLYWVDGHFEQGASYWDDGSQSMITPDPTYVYGGYFPFSTPGTYSQGTFSISGYDISSVNLNGTPWSPNPPPPDSHPPFDHNYVAGGPPELWVNGTPYYHAAEGGVDKYYDISTPPDPVSPIPYWGGEFRINGMPPVTCAYSPNPGGGVVLFGSRLAYDLRPLDANGHLMVTTTTPAYGPPGVAVNGQRWVFQGTVATVDYYAGSLPRQRLQISSDMSAALFDGPFGTNGFYITGVFQNLSEPVVPLDAHGAVTSSHGQGPDTVIVNGVVWHHSTEGGTAYDAYYGNTSGQVLDLYGGSVWISDPYNNINTTGTYANGVFQMLGTGVTVQAADTGGVLMANSHQNRTQNSADNSTVAGSLDVYGNLFSLGTWQGDSTTAGLSLSFTDRPPGTTGTASTISLVSNRPSNQWIWSHANIDLSSTTPMMKLDQVNRLMLFSTTDGAPQIVLDPQGSSTFPSAVNIQGRLRINMQGDVTMGPFTSEPAQ